MTPSPSTIEWITHRDPDPSDAHNGRVQLLTEDGYIELAGYNWASSKSLPWAHCPGWKPQRAPVAGEVTELVGVPRRLVEKDLDSLKTAWEARQQLRLTAIIREVDGNRDLGAAALAEAILSHPQIGGVMAPQTPESDRRTADYNRGREDGMAAGHLRGEADAMARQAPPPSDGEVAEIVAHIRSGLSDLHPRHRCLGELTVARLTRAADLLEHRRSYDDARCRRLQQEQHRFREPERTILCDILANGTLLPDPDGVRYGIPGEESPSHSEIANLSDWLLMLRDGPPGMASRYNNRLTRIAEILTRYARPAPTPVPVGERLPETKDCDDDGQPYVSCWFLCKRVGEYEWHRINPPSLTCCYELGYTHWLPWWALPLPEKTS